MPATIYGKGTSSTSNLKTENLIIMATAIILLQFAIVLALIFKGARTGGIGLGIYGMVGVFILVFIFGLKPGNLPNEENKQILMDYARKNIAKYALPYDIEFRPDLPKTLVGKVAYRVLEEEELAKLAAEKTPE